MAVFEYDLVVIGSGPAGHNAAIQGAKLHKRVMIIERRPVVGGICINTGTIPSKTLREAVIYLSGYREHSFYGESYSVKDRITLQDLLFRVDPVVRHEIDVSRNQLKRNGIELINAEASFVDAHKLRLAAADGRGEQTVTADRVVICVGTEATRDSRIPFDGRVIFSSDDILSLDALPQTLAVIGAGVIGCEYASMFAALGVRVTLVDMRPRLLPFVDDEIVEALAYHLRERRVTLRLGEEVNGIEIMENDTGRHVRISLASGKQIMAHKALCSIGRSGATASLNLKAAGVECEPRGRVRVNERFQTNVENIHAAGDVIGFPSLASTSARQGRLAACHALGVPADHESNLWPYGIFTLPEISFVGRNEQELTEAGVPYEVGKAPYREAARGQIIGDRSGMLKLIFHRETRRLLGVHIIGDGASELVHIGQTVLAFEGTIDYFVNTVFNFPTLAECYKDAAFDGLNRMIG